ncbi:MAG: glycosyltransferase family 2 protein [Janthinobacterium lividum]|jgi:GT2 family glycosyltransferase|uniref:glycosyltransferase family 2 protein n=1 Tax=Pseudomonas TaxID=286 RepID=UPI001CFC0514|nr:MULTISPECIES: galactosyltransferase-related protein [Pseudomonas]
MNVITLVHGRERQLRNLILGLERSTQPIAGLWVVFMNQPPLALHSPHFPIHALRIDEPDGRLPLARARNAVTGQGAEWVFLDVDCIPAADLIATYTQALHAHPQALHLGEVRYLPEAASTAQWSAASLLRDAVAHPLAVHRTAPGTAMPYALFWSLNFACSAATFARIGGFDEGYAGYGGEDTDFAFRAQAQGVTLLSAAALAFHQYHPMYDPPLNHLEAIVANAQRFYRQWQRWPMEGWLQGFVERGLVRWTASELEVLRLPSQAQIDACLTTRGY